MTQKEIEIILARQLADHLSTPIFIVDAAGTMLFYNPPAEKLLGLRFEETGEIPAAEWSTVFNPVDDDGTPLAPESLPLMIALVERRPAHREFLIQGLDSVRRRIQVTAMPVIGHAGRFLGAISIFWEVPAG